MSEFNASELDVWVLAGQSNMEGCGFFQGASSPDKRVWCFSSAGQWEMAQEPLHRFWESFTPVHQNFLRPNLAEDQRALSDAELAEQRRKTRVQGAGLGIAFGTAMAEHTGRKIGLIAAAHGGTSLEQWNFNRKDQGGASLYGAMLERIRVAGGQLRGVLWYQGESDCDPQQSRTYQQRFEAWISDLRSQLGMPQLPVIVVQLGRFITEPHSENAQAWDRVRDALISLPQHIPAVGATSAIDLGLADSIHIDTAGLIRLGRRMAKIATQVESHPGEIAGPQVVSIEDGSFSPQTGTLVLRCRGVNGSWLPREHMSGFATYDSEGLPHPTLKVVNASADLEDPTAIRVLLNGPLSPDLRIGYGLGFNPYCNVVDEADMPLCAFLPRAV